MTGHDYLALAEGMASGAPDYARAYALIDIAASLRELVEQGKPEVLFERVKMAEPLQFRSLSHPSCRSSRWSDRDGDEWRIIGGEWNGFVHGRWIPIGVDVPNDQFGPFTRIFPD